VLDINLRMLHPIMPFLTEELWEKFPHDGTALSTAAWPRSDERRFDPDAEAAMETLQELVVKIRNLRAEAGIDPGKRIDVLLLAASPGDRALVAEQAGLVKALVRAGSVTVVDAFPAGLVAARGVVRSLEAAIPLEGLLDLDAERDRLTRELAKIDREVEVRNRKLANESFLERAPAAVVEKERSIQQEFLDKKRRIESTLATLGGGGAAR
jgi:valyl-tRNA synthetase